tara:strand:- start:3352 stop:4014 length:663 start_codon:yes stop_codon:yes gene_type:complete
MKNVVLIGAGTALLYSIDIVEKEGKYNIIGIIDSSLEISKELYGYKIIGRQENLLDLIKDYNINGGIITIGDNWTRYNIYQEILKIKPDFNWYNAMHPSVIIGKNVNLGFGILVMAGVIINSGATIGNFCHLYTSANIEHDCIIGNYASISAGSITGGYVELGEFAAVTLGVTVFDRTKIGRNSVVGAGSLVVKDLPENVLAYGNPAKIIRPREDGEKFL